MTTICSRSSGVALGEALVAVHVDQAVIYVVADYVDARLVCHARHGVKRRCVEDAARRVVGRADDDGLSRRCHAGTKRLLINLELRRLRIQKDRLGMVGHDDALVQAKGRRGDNDLVAGLSIAMNVADRASVAPSVRMTSSAENVRPASPM